MTAFIVVKSTGDGTFLDTFDAWLSNTAHGEHFINDRPTSQILTTAALSGPGAWKDGPLAKGGRGHIITAKYDFSTGDITTLYNGDPNSYTGCSPGAPLPCNHTGATITFDQIARYFDGVNPGIDAEGDLAEIQFFDEHLSAAAEDAVGFALGQKWGIQTDYTGDFRAPTVNEWSFGGSGDWNAPSNWDTGAVPDGFDQTAIVGAGIMTIGQTVFTNTAVTVNQVQFNNTLPYAIAGLGSINFVATTVDPSVPPGIDVQSGSHQFQTIVNLHGDTTANIVSDSMLEFNHRLFLNGNTLTKTGGGTLMISNDVVLAGGTIHLQQGTIAGNGTLGGDVVNDGGTISPGNQNLQANSVVPEPATWLLLGVGLLMTAICGIRKKRPCIGEA